MASDCVNAWWTPLTCFYAQRLQIHVHLFDAAAHPAPRRPGAGDCSSCIWTKVGNSQVGYGERDNRQQSQVQELKPS